MDVSPYCPQCKNHYETLEHLIFNCKFSREVWSLSSIDSSPSNSWDQLSFKDWWNSIAQGLPTGANLGDIGDLIASICWSIWKARNKTYFDKEVWYPEIILDKAITLISEFKASQIM